jgi:hypothetical protein
MPAFLYIADHNPLREVIKSSNLHAPHVTTTITHTTGEYDIILPAHPHLPVVTVIAVTKAINDPEPKTSIAVSLTSLLLYYEFYKIPAASDLAIRLHLTSPNFNHAASNILYLARNRQKFQMGTYLKHMRAAAKHFNCPFLFLTQFGKPTHTITKDAHLLAHHFRQHAAIKAAHAPYAQEYMSLNETANNNDKKPVFSEAQATYYTCIHCGITLRDTYTKRLTHPSKCPANKK